MIVLRLECKGNILLNILMASVMCLQFSMQEEDIDLTYSCQVSFV